jgi:hypothetical protein
MLDPITISRYGRERHQEMLKQAEEIRLAKSVMKGRKSPVTRAVQVASIALMNVVRR